MKRYMITLALLCSALPFALLTPRYVVGAAFAQYEEQKEQRVQENRPFADIPTFDSPSPMVGIRGGLLFNFDWRFTTGNPQGAEQPDFDDSAWRRLDLPHDFQFEQPWDESAGGARGFKAPGEGWYRKTFHAPETWRGLQVLLDFGGLMYYGDVYVNGHKVASSEYGYLGFETDIARHLKYGADNVVAVYANTGKPKASRWYTGGGLFRDVYLHLQNPTHIARHGIFVTTPEITDKQATVAVQVDVAGFKKYKTVVRATVRDAEGHDVGTTEATMNNLTKHQHDEIQLPHITIPNPKRWDLDTPYLYTVEVDVLADDMLVDRQSEAFGVRTIEYSPRFGFKLNGRKVFLKGMANHHDLGALGVASFDKAIERQFAMMKAFGFNSLRCSHNPYSESLTRIADRMGLLIVDELIDKWSDDEYWGGRKPFTQLWPELIQEWVTRDRNCPSVVLWSLGNELQTRDNWSGYKTNDWGITTYRLFDVMVKRYDPTRKTTVAQFPARAGAIREEKEFKTYFAPPELGVATEVSSFNYQWDAYPKYFEYAPDMILYQSEAVTNQMQAPFYGMDRARTVGLAYWGAIEYWGESNKWPKKGWNFSFFRHTLQPHPQAWLIKGAFEPEEPVVRIGVLTNDESLSWNAIQVGQKTYMSMWDFPEGSTQQVTVFTNAEEVELVLDGKWKTGKNGEQVMTAGQSLGRQQSDTTDVFKRGIIKWAKVPYGQGGTLTAIAYNGGKEVARHQLETPGKAVALKIEAEPCPLTGKAQSAVLRADGMDLLYVNIYAVDAKGRVVSSFNEPLTVSIEGEATLLALDNADHYTDLLFHDVSTKPMQLGYMQAILRATHTAGRATLRATTPSLRGTLKIESKSGRE